MARWIVLAAGLVIQTVLGGVYAWSVFVPPLTASYGLSKGQSGFIFGAMIATFTLAMIPAGRLLQRSGPRLTAGIGAALFAAGYLSASYSGGSYPLLLLSLGVITGAGIGFGYVCPLTVGMRWFPNNKGLVTGVAVAGFGGGGIVLSYLVEHLLQARGMMVLEVFRVIGLGLGTVALAAAMMLREPPRPASAAPAAGTMDLRAAMASREFLLICACMFAGTFAGLLTVGNLKPLVLSLGLSERLTVASVSLFAAGNAAGRILWGQVHDRLRSRKTIPLSLTFLGAAITLFLLPLPEPFILAASFAGGLGFGSCFVVYASSIVEFFGVESFPRLYPVCFLGYGLAGLTGPATGGWMADRLGNYDAAVGLAAGILVAALAGILLLFRAGRAVRVEPAV